jgi:uncharacterized membrane protein YfcA
MTSTDLTAALLGLLIATAIGLTGVGGGTITTPLLILVLRMKGAVAVGTALTFAAIVKFLIAPMYLFRRQVDFKILAWMCLGGVPGVIAGGLFLNKLSKQVDQRMLYIILGVTIVVAAALNIYRLVRFKGSSGTGDHPRWLAALMLPVGAEVGFSSAGSGALGSLSLLGLTRLSAAKVVGTDICFGLVLSILGSGIQIFAGNYNGRVLEFLLLGGVVGSFAGGMLALRIPSRPLKWGLAIWLAALGIQLFVRGIGS